MGLDWAAGWGRGATPISLLTSVDGRRQVLTLLHAQGVSEDPSPGRRAPHGSGGRGKLRCAGTTVTCRRPHDGVPGVLQPLARGRWHGGAEHQVLEGRHRREGGRGRGLGGLEVAQRLLGIAEHGGTSARATLAR